MSKLKLNKILAIVGALVLYVVVLWMVPHTPDSAVLLLQKSTGLVVVFVAQMLGLTAHYNTETQVFGVAGFDMFLAVECVALHYFAILWLSIALMPRQRIHRKVLGWFSCTAILFGVNVLRLILLGVVGHNFPQYFDFMHDFVWQVVFSVLTFVLCFIWTEKAKIEAGVHSSLIIVSTLCAACFALLLNFGKIYYLTLMAWFSDKILLLIYSDASFTNRWWAITNKNFVMIRLQGERILYQMPNGGGFTVNIWQDLLSMALFLGLCSASLLTTVRCHEWNSSKTGLIIGMVGGTLLLLLMQACSLVSLGAILVTQTETTLAKEFLWLMRGLSVLTPAFLWWLIWRKKTSMQVFGEGVSCLVNIER